MPDIGATSWRHRATAPICMVPTSECLYAQSTHWRHLLFKVLYNFPQQALLLRTPTGVREEKYTVLFILPISRSYGQMQSNWGTR